MYVGELTEKGYIRFIFQRLGPSVESLINTMAKLHNYVWT